MDLHDSFVINLREVFNKSLLVGNVQFFFNINFFCDKEMTTAVNFT